MVLCVAGWSLGGVAGVVLLARVFLCDVVACLLTLPFDTRISERSCALSEASSPTFCGNSVAEIYPIVAALVGDVFPVFVSTCQAECSSSGTGASH